MFLEYLGVDDITSIVGEEIRRAAAENDSDVFALIMRAKAERDAQSFDRARAFQGVCLDHHENLY